MSLRSLMSALAVALILMAGGPPAAARGGSTYYVAPDGLDTNPGSLTRPWATIGHAAAVMGPGDTALIRGGLYEEGVQIGRSGSAGAPITFAAYPGETPILDGSGIGAQDGFSLAAGHAYIVVAGLKVQNFSRYALVLWGNNQQVELRQVELVGSDVGLKLTDAAIPGGFVADVGLVELNVHDNRGAGVSCSPGPCRRVRIVDSVAARNGTLEEAGADGFGFEAGESIALERCRATSNGGSGFDLKADKARIVRSLSADNALSGIQLWGAANTVENSIMRDNRGAGLVLEGSGPYTVTNSIAAHNALQSGGYGLVAGPESSAVLGLKLYNSIFAFNGGPIFFGESVVLQEDHNIYFSQEASEIQAAFMPRYNYSRSDLYSGIWFMETGNGRHSASVDPQFVSVEGRDYHSQEGAPAIDAGSNAWAPTEDYDGVRRPRGNGADIGAYEYWQPAAMTWLPLVVHHQNR